jgi:hypothetical protein
MAKLLCVFSTLRPPTNTWTTSRRNGDPGRPPDQGGSVIIKGGAGVANENLQTPRGVPTMVTEAQAELLKRNEVFKLHEKNGFVAIDEVERRPPRTWLKRPRAEHEGRDNSAPLVAADFNGAPPTVNDGAPVAAAKRTRATAAA